MFSLFCISCQILQKFAPWMPPPVLHCAPVATFFPSFLSFTYSSSMKTGLLDVPSRVDAWGLGHCMNQCKKIKVKNFKVHPFLVVMQDETCTKKRFMEELCEI